MFCCIKYLLKFILLLKFFEGKIIMNEYTILTDATCDLDEELRKNLK